MLPRVRGIWFAGYDSEAGVITWGLRYFQEVGRGGLGRNKTSLQIAMAVHFKPCLGYSQDKIRYRLLACDASVTSLLQKLEKELPVPILAQSSPHSPSTRIRSLRTDAFAMRLSSTSKEGELDSEMT